MAHKTIFASNSVRSDLAGAVALFLANGGKIKRVPCRGIMPRDGGRHYCDPRDRAMLTSAMVTRPCRGVQRITTGVSRLIKA